MILGVSDRSFRRYVDSYKEHGLEGLADKCLTQVSHRRSLTTKSGHFYLQLMTASFLFKKIPCWNHARQRKENGTPAPYGCITRQPQGTPWPVM